MATRLEIVTPKGRIFSDDVDAVVVPGSEGELGVLTSHVPLVTPLKPGVLRAIKGDEQQRFAVGSGFLEVTRESVTVLSDLAVGEDEIDVDAVELAMKNAQDALGRRDMSMDSEQVAALQILILNSQAQLDVKRHKRQR